MRATHATVKQMARIVKGNDHTLCVYNFCSPQKLNHCDSRPNHLEMQENSGRKKMKGGNFQVSTAGDRTAMVSEDKYDMI
jgi:hypothetical protein